MQRLLVHTIYSFIQQAFCEVGPVPGAVLVPGAPALMVTDLLHVGYFWGISLMAFL